MSPYRDDYRQGQSEFLWTLPRVMFAVFVSVLAVFLLMVAFTPLTIGFGWFKGEANLRSFSKVQETYREAFDDVNAMEANVTQACRIQRLADEAKAAGDTVTYNQRQSQVAAIENNYDRVKGEYESYMSDHFRGNIIRPQQLPLPYPSLADSLAAACPTNSG